MSAEDEVDVKGEDSGGSAAEEEEEEEDCEADRGTSAGESVKEARRDDGAVESRSGLTSRA